MKKYRCKLIPDVEHIKRFDLTFEAENEMEAENQTIIEVKQNADDDINNQAKKERRV